MCGATTRILPGKSWAGSENRCSVGSGNVLEYLEGLPGAFVPGEQLGSSKAAGGQRGVDIRIQQDLADRARDRFGNACVHRKRRLPRDLLETIEGGRDNRGTAGECLRDRNREGFRKRRIEEEVGQRIDRRQVLLVDPARKVNVPAVSIFGNRVLGPEAVAA